MDAREFIKVGMSAERTLVVPPERGDTLFVDMVGAYDALPAAHRRATRALQPHRAAQRALSAAAAADRGTAARAARR